MDLYTYKSPARFDSDFPSISKYTSIWWLIPFSVEPRGQLRYRDWIKANGSTLIKSSVPGSVIPLLSTWYVVSIWLNQWYYPLPRYVLLLFMVKLHRRVCVCVFVCVCARALANAMFLNQKLHDHYHVIWGQQECLPKQWIKSHSCKASGFDNTCSAKQTRQNKAKTEKK